MEKCQINDSLLITTDWGEEWKKLQAARQHADDASFWDERSKTYGVNDEPSEYAQKFIEFARLQPGERVFDMGCGTGALALPLAERGYEVFAADFSSGMLSRLHEQASKKGLEIPTLQISWEDDWAARGLAPKSFDVAFASRSIATADLKDSIQRMSTLARHRCCITLSASSSPRSDNALLRAIGINATPGFDYWYAVNILIQMGYQPEVRYIDSPRYDSFDTYEEAFELLERMLKSVAAFTSEADLQTAHTRLHDWVREHTVENPAYGQPDQKRLVFSTPRVISWAFISWEC